MNRAFDLVGLLAAAAWVGLLLLVFRLAWSARTRAVRALLFVLGLLMMAMLLWNTFL
jgi:hypothetical protein